MSENKRDDLLENIEEAVEITDNKISDNVETNEDASQETKGDASQETKGDASQEIKEECTPEEMEKKQEEERERQLRDLEERKEKRKKKKKRRKIAGVMVTVCALMAAAGVGTYHLYDLMNQYKEQSIQLQETVKGLEKEIKVLKGEEVVLEEETAPQEQEETVSGEAEETAAKVETSEDSENVNDENKTEKESKEEIASEEEKTVKKYLKKAKKYAQQYDYDKAIKLLKKYENYDSCEEMQKAVTEYKEIKASCVSWPIEEVTHIFYHTMIKDTSKSFDGDYKAGNYNQVMTTIDEFNKITQSMYDRGYVMVSMYDMATVAEDGTMERGEILLPPGKIPFVLSQDDVSYYHYMDGDGYATKLIVDEDGKVRNEYIEDDGSISIGDYDMVPLIDRFVEEHPDFSYRGAKGIIALTGYNGVLGYRTDISYETRPDDLDDVKVKWLEENPDFDLEKEREEATKVATAMKENGWLFASHTWGHLNVQEASLERLKADTEKFKENVEPIIGETDIIIFAFGTDLTEVEDYSGEKFEYYKEQGYNYFCNVDSSKYFVQLRDNYLRMGRRNLDGYRMYYNPEMLEDLFVVDEVFDQSRPLPVPEM